ncbi:hypothetical protein UNPF46_27820 [Bradyrhizobium sp. UNPF46]|uniref:COG3904 family protein n=1 Tax=Bradyrhizobium sp. UNPF46 TaxID=1141168 RepID=UPI00115201AA|nr:hypothetical protein [Bradyrhizobium sp. UNPF46]TQF28140.1 hypothetical protein UNPF46_27820 [Bradyrhizobium sp. UNPF46]
MAQLVKAMAWRKIYALALLLAFQSGSADAQSNMTVKGFPPELPIEIAGNGWFVFLDGDIDPDAPQRFEQYVTQNRIPDRSIVYLNSPGGSLAAGIELGRLFRKYGFSTDIGRKSPFSPKRYDIDAGGCYSACAYAYLGGQFRYLKQGSRYGVHQFKSVRADERIEGTAQVISALAVEYMRSMDVDPDLFTLSAAASPDGMQEIDKVTLERLNVVNNGRTRPVWTIESTGGQLYLKGQRTTEESGINKFILYCEKRRAVLLAIFDTLRRDAELMNMAAHSLLIDGQVYRLRPDSKRIQNGLFNVAYTLSQKELVALRKGENVGVAIQASYEAPIFLGFEGMSIGSGKLKLVGILDQCAL